MGVGHSSNILEKFESSKRSSEKFSNTKVYVNLSIESQIIPRGRTDRKKEPIVLFSNLNERTSKAQG